MAVKRLSIDGEIFNSITEVSKAFDMSVVEISSRLANKNYPTWKYHED